jgi:rod shape-determining protein MreC
MNTSPTRIWQPIALGVLVVGLLLLAISGYMGDFFSTAMDPFIAAQRWFATRYMAIYEFVTVPRDVASLRQRNAELENELSRLQLEVIQLQEQLQEARILYALLDFARENPENQYMAAAVIGRDPSPFLQYIIIDHGSDSGLRHGMPVVTQQGLVGRIDAVTANAARVQLISDAASVVNVHIQNANADALLYGSLTGDTTVEMVPQSVALQVGDLILTSGLGGNYPSDIVVGQIVNIRKQETDLFQSASVQTTVDFANLSAVLVITNFKSVDISPLEPNPGQ